MIFHRSTRQDSLRPGKGVRLSWLVAAWTCIIGVLLIGAGFWISSTAPGTLEVNQWLDMTSVKFGFTLFQIGAIANLVGGVTCAWLLILGSYRLSRYGDSDHVSRIKELLWNVSGLLVAGCLVIAAATTD
jgi:hypothetical protein